MLRQSAITSRFLLSSTFSLFGQKAFHTSQPFRWTPRAFTNTPTVWTADIFWTLIDPKFAPNYNSEYRSRGDSDEFLEWFSTPRQNVQPVPMSVNDGWISSHHTHEITKSLPYMREFLANRYPEIAAYARTIKDLLTDLPPESHKALAEIINQHTRNVEEIFGKTQTLHPFTKAEIDDITAAVTRERMESFCNHDFKK